MSDDGTSTTFSPSSTEFWSSEDDFDVAQIMTKRVTYTVYTWLFRVMIMIGLMMVLTFIICVPVTIVLLILNSNIRRVIVRKRKYWENDEYLLAEVLKKVDKKMKIMEKEKQQQSLKAMKEARQEYQMLAKLMGTGGGGGGGGGGGRRGGGRMRGAPGGGGRGRPKRGGRFRRLFGRGRKRR